MEGENETMFRKLVTNGETITLSNTVIDELHRQEKILCKILGTIFLNNLESLGIEVNNSILLIPM